MQHKIFISYSHKDESFKDSLDEHLSTLKRNKIIDIWHDRKIIPGQEWATEISENLKTSTIVLFLVSPSFLASEYCVSIEAQHAIQMHNQGSAILVPIIVRSCDWGDTPFSKFQGLPKNATPIRNWTDEDTAWLDVVNGLKKLISDFKPTSNSSTTVTLTTSTTPSSRAVQSMRILAKFPHETTSPVV